MLLPKRHLTFSTLPQTQFILPTAAGTELLDYSQAVMLDATTKACHFTNAGRSQKLLAPKSSTYLGAVAHQAVADFESGVLKSEAQQKWAEHCAASTAGGSCSSQLTCSRPSASVRGVVDVAGLAGVPPSLYRP